MLEQLTGLLWAMPRLKFEEKLKETSTSFFFFFLLDSFTFEEYEAIQGDDDVQIPSYYSGKISAKGKIIKGKTVGDSGNDDEDDATFQLDLVEDEGLSFHFILITL